MKKLICVVGTILLVILTYKGIKHHFDYKLYIKDPCITKKKLDEKTKEYWGYLSNERMKISNYRELTQAVYDELTQNNKYTIYRMPGKKKVEFNDSEEYIGDFFLGSLGKSEKNTVAGEEEILRIEDSKTHKEVFSLKSYQVYLYNQMPESTPDGSASVVVQFKCALEKSQK